MTQTTPNPAGRVDLLLLRIVERITRSFEQQTGLSGVWEAIAPTVAETVQGKKKGARRT